MKDHVLVKELISLFRCRDFYEAHDRSKPILKEMAHGQEFLEEMVRFNLSQPEYLRKKRHYPTQAMQIFENEHFQLVANIWLPLPDRREDLSFQSIHHHGHLLLTSVAAFGPGYETILFKNDFSLDPVTFETQMTIDKIYRHTRGSVEFCDRWTPHVVFCPGAYSITLALWSFMAPPPWARLRKWPILKPLKRGTSHLLRKMGLGKNWGLNSAEFYDFYPENGKLWALKERVGFEVGTEENFIRNVFYGLQELQFSDHDFIRKLCSLSFVSPRVQVWADKFLKGEPIRDEFDLRHLSVPRVNLTKAEILNVFQNAGIRAAS